MDIISEFLTNSASRSRGGKIDLHALLQSLGSLVSRQRQSGAISLGYVRSVLLRSNQLFTEGELDFHCALILESSLQYLLDPSDHIIRLVVRNGVMENEIEFLNAILCILHTKSSEIRECPQVLLDFKKSVSVYCASKFAASSRREVQPLDQQMPQRLLRTNIPPQVTVSRGSNIFEQGSKPSSGDRMSSRSGTYSSVANPLLRPIASDKRYARAVAPAVVVTTTVNGRGSSTTQCDKAARPMLFQNNHQKCLQDTAPYFRTWVELQDSVVRFLAQVRKQGMDIIFPKTSHDKVLAAIYVAVQVAANPAHRELIDMVMTLKDKNIVPGLDALSKTKIRGVLALLKHGKMLDATGTEGQPVQLALALNITSFQELRKVHDKYLDEFAKEFQVEMSFDLWGEIVWYERSEAKNIEYLNNTSTFIEELKVFYAMYVPPTRLEDDNGAHDKDVDTKYVKPVVVDISAKVLIADNKRSGSSVEYSQPSRNLGTTPQASVLHNQDHGRVRYPQPFREVYSINNSGVPMYQTPHPRRGDQIFPFPSNEIRNHDLPTNIRDHFIGSFSGVRNGGTFSGGRSMETHHEPQGTASSFRNYLSATFSFPTRIDDLPANQSIQSLQGPLGIYHTENNVHNDDIRDSAQTDTDSSSPNSEVLNLNLWTSSEMVSPDYFKSLADNPRLANLKICSPRKLQQGLATTSSVEFTSLFNEVSPISIAEHPYQVSAAPIRFSFTQEEGTCEKSKTPHWNGLFDRQSTSISLTQDGGPGVHVAYCDSDDTNQIVDAYFTHGISSGTPSTLTSTTISGDPSAVNINFKRSASLSIDVNDLHLSDSGTMHLYWRDAEGRFESSSSCSDISGILSDVADSISCTFGHGADGWDGSTELFSPQQGANARFMVDNILNSLPSPIKKAKMDDYKNLLSRS